MNRKHFMFQTGLASLAIALPFKKMIANYTNQEKNNLKTIRNNIGIYTESGGTLGYYFCKDGVIVIDSQFSNSIVHFLELGKTNFNSPYRYLINTHHHADHTSGNIAFKGIVDNIVGHENCLINYKKHSEDKKIVERQLYQNVTFKKNWGITFGQEKIEAHYFGAAHTNGDAVIHFENTNIVHIGDLVFNKLYPYIDPNNGGNFKNWILVLENIIHYFDNNTIFIFGHGSNSAVTGNLEDLKSMKKYIEELLNYVYLQKKQGNSLETILKTTTEIPNVGLWKDEYKQIKSNLTEAFNEV